MPDSRDAGDPKSRPSFTGYWKRSKDQQATKNLTFITSKLGQSSAPGEQAAEAEPSAETKARDRRQQVRKAQLQHRQRKANYIKQLEIDVTNLRDDIAKVEQEVANLKDQNDTIRSELARGDQVVLPMALDVPPSDAMDMAFSTWLAPSYTVSLDMSEYLVSPAFQVRRALPSLSDTVEEGTSSHTTEMLGRVTSTSTVGATLEDGKTIEIALSEAQTDRAINFILALEHCCWDHVDQSCFARHDHHLSSKQEQKQPEFQRPRCPLAANTQTPTYDDNNANNADEEEAESYEGLVNGHTLTATALALQSAPPEVFDQISNLQQQLYPAPSSTPTLTPIPATPAPAPAPRPITFSSQTLTLANLRRLARTLNPSDTELAPVQVWFELVSHYGIAAATDEGVLEALKRELASEMRCVTFGAAVQRDIFEDVVEKVVGFLPRSWRAGEESMNAAKPNFLRKLLHTAKGGDTGR